MLETISTTLLHRRSQVVRSSSSGSARHPPAAIPKTEQCPLRVRSDSPASRGMMTWRGSGRVNHNHLDIKALWCQEAIEKGRFQLVNVDSEKNPADIGTKTLSAKRIFISYGYWEWTQHEHCWITVESNEDDPKKGSGRSRCDSKVEVRAPWKHERGRSERTGQAELNPENSSCAKDSRQNG